MSSKGDEVRQLSEDIVALGHRIEAKRREVAALLVGSVALDRRGQRYVIDQARVVAGGSGYKLWVDGRLLKKDGAPHARTRCSNPIMLLAKISKGEEAT